MQCVSGWLIVVVYIVSQNQLFAYTRRVESCGARRAALGCGYLSRLARLCRFPGQTIVVLSLRYGAALRQRISGNSRGIGTGCEIAYV